MNILTVDDEKLSLESLEKAISKVIPDANIAGFQQADKVVDYVKEAGCDIAFLDIQLKGTNGLSLAKQLMDVNPRINIIFSTGYSDYMSEAFEISASGYLVKPITPLKVQEALENLRYPLT